MKKITITTVIIIIIAGIGYWFYHYHWQSKENLILFEKQENWGPCPSNNICNQTTKLYYSGELVLEGEKNIKKELNKGTMEKIKDRIRLTGIMNKDCFITAPVPDYSATYIFDLDGEIKNMRFPNCEQELKEIEELMKT